MTILTKEILETKIVGKIKKKNPSFLDWGHKIKYQLSLKLFKNFFQCINQAN